MGANQLEARVSFTLSNFVQAQPAAATKGDGHRGTEKARASEEHWADSMVASVFDAASSVIPADDDVVSSLEHLVAPSGNGKCFRNSVSLWPFSRRLMRTI